MSIRPVKKIITSKPTMEGAGVKLRRAFGFGETSETDPFLLLDDFRNDRPEEYRAGFPWHPHRGIETEFGIKIPDRDMTPSNFRSIAQIDQLIGRLAGTQETAPA